MKYKNFFSGIIFLSKTINNEELKNIFIFESILKLNSYNENIEENYNDFLNWTYKYFLELKKNDNVSTHVDDIYKEEDLNIIMLQKIIDLDIINKHFFDFLMQLIIKNKIIQNNLNSFEIFVKGIDIDFNL